MADTLEKEQSKKEATPSSTSKLILTLKKTKISKSSLVLKKEGTTGATAETETVQVKSTEIKVAETESKVKNISRDSAQHQESIQKQQQQPASTLASASPAKPRKYQPPHRKRGAHNNSNSRVNEYHDTSANTSSIGGSVLNY
jgi:hypothetical protein